MTSRRILHLIPSLEGGGAERQLAMLAVEQARRGWDVHVGLRRGGVHLERLQSGGVAVHMLGDYRGFDPRLLFTIGKLMGRIHPILVQTWLPQMDIAGGAPALLRGIPWIACERASELAYLDRPAYYCLRRSCVRRASAVVANSALGQDYWRRCLPSSLPVFRVGNAVDISAIRNVAPQPQMPEKGDHIISVGRVTYQKAPEVLVTAMAQLSRFPPLHLHLFGEGDMRPQIEDAIRSAHLQDRVTLHPYHSDWWSLLHGARALVSASRFEGLPNVVLEAMAGGCPLVVTDIPEHREILDEATALIVPVNAPDALANAIAAVLSDPEAARRRAERASARVAGMSVGAVAQAYDDIYATVIDRVA